MPRLLGVEIPAKKKVAYSLRYINGIGPTRADLLIKEAGLNPDMRAHDLHYQENPVYRSVERSLPDSAVLA